MGQVGRSPAVTGALRDGSALVGALSCAAVLLVGGAWSAVAADAASALADVPPAAKAPAQPPSDANPKPPARPRGPGPRVSIGGLRSIDASSTIVYEGHPELLHRLQVTYAFPDRSRWWLGVIDEAAPRRRMLFESGESLCALESGATASRELVDSERTDARMQLGMRRALFAWPHGQEWKRAGRVATCALGSIGTLEAHFASDEAQEPDVLAFSDVKGTRVDEYRAIAWRKPTPGDKAWPTRLELWHAGAKVWTETVLEVDTRTRSVDSFFVPPDRREGASGRALEPGSVRAMDLPEQRTRRFPLAANTSWDVARDEYARLCAKVGEELKARGLALENRATFEVSDSLTPTAVVLRLAPTTPASAVTKEVDEQWPRTPERPAMATFVTGLAEVAPGRMIPLRDALPADAVPGTPYVRFDPRHPESTILIVLPVGAKDG